MVVFSALTSLGKSAHNNGNNFKLITQDSKSRPDKLGKYLVHIHSLKDMCLEAMDKINTLVLKGSVAVGDFQKDMSTNRWFLFVDVENDRTFSLSAVASSESENKHLCYLTAAIILDETYEISDDFNDEDVTQVKIWITHHDDPGRCITFCSSNEI